VDLKELCRYLGGAREKHPASYMLPESTVEQMRAKIQQLRIEQSGKGSSKRERDGQSKAGKGSGNLFPAVSQRNTSVPQVKQQCFASETQAPPHLLQQNTKHANCPIPNPLTHDGEAQNNKNRSDPDKQEPDELLRWARMRFTGLVDDIRNHLLDKSKPPNLRFQNGYQDWEEFGFGHMAVKAAKFCGDILVLTISAPDPAAAQRGLVKYHRTWDLSTLKWFEGEVRTVLLEVLRES
jgi:hypothetical protein